MYKIIIFFISCLSLQTGFSQDAINQAQTDLFGNPFNSSNQMMIRALSSFENGSDNNDFFIFPEWKSMEAFGKSGQHIIADSSNVVLNGGKILFYRKGELLQLFGSITKEVVIENRTFMPFPSNKKSLNGTLQFFEVLVNDDFKLLRDWKVEEKSVSDNPMGIVHDSKTELVKSSKLYYVNEKGRLVLVPARKKDFIQIFGRNQSKMIEFAKKEKLSNKSEEDVIKFFNHYNKILDEK